MLLQAYAELFRARDCIAAQLLLTLDDLEDRQRYLNVSTTLERLFQNGAVPVINENDSVATNEIKFGDNDRLAARVAQAAFANGIILLSDVEGLFTADPALINGAKLVRIVDDLAKAAAMAGSGSRSGLGSGGMRSKLMAAKIAHQTGVPLAIALGTQAHPLKRFIDSGHGTLILPATAVTSGKKSWLLGRLTVAGSIHVDTGAEIALRAGKSLLPSGVIEVFGKFDAGAVVEVVCGERTIARGLANYASPEARSIAGLRTDQLEACLGYPPRRTFIHANHLVLL
jgi:glutamate 5-kinase